MLTLDQTQPGTRVTIAFLACGCHTLHHGPSESDAPHAGERVECPNPHTCTCHRGGWSTITQTLTGTVQPPGPDTAA